GRPVRHRPFLPFPIGAGGWSFVGSLAADPSNRRHVQALILHKACSPDYAVSRRRAGRSASQPHSRGQRLWQDPGRSYAKSTTPCADKIRQHCCPNFLITEFFKPYKTVSKKNDAKG